MSCVVGGGEGGETEDEGERGITPLTGAEAEGAILSDRATGSEIALLMPSQL